MSQIVENDEIIDVDYVFEVDKPVERWMLVDASETPFEMIEIGEELQIRAEELAEKISMLCRTRGRSTSVMALCLNQGDVVIDVDDLSNVPAAELTNAVRYHVAAAGNFAVDNVLSDCVELGERVWMEGISASDARIWSDAWKKNSMQLAVLTAIPDNFNAIDDIEINNIEITSGLRNAIGAARIAAFQSSPNLLSDELKRLSGWDFRKFAAAVAALTLLGLSSFFAVDHWQYNQTAEALAIENEQLAYLEQDQRLKNAIERELGAIDRRRQLIAELSKEVFPWRSVLIHFGTFHVDGVWLNQITSTDDKSIELRGEAVDYEAMSEFIETLEEDDDFFKHEPEIRSAQSARGGETIEFVVRIPMS